MKKLLSIVLAGTLALGLSLPGFGAASAAKVTKFAPGKTLGDGVVKAELPEGAALSSDRKTLKLGTQYALDEVEIYINLTASMFGLADTVLSGANAKEYAILEVENFRRSKAIFAKVQQSRPKKWADVDTMLKTAEKYTHLTDGSYDDASKKWSRPDTTTAGDYIDWLDRYISAGSEEYPLVTWVSSAKRTDCLYFTDLNDRPISQSTEGRVVSRNLTSQEITQNRITAGTTLSANSSAIRDVVMQRNSGRIRIRLTNEWVSTAKKSFETTLHLSFNGKRASDQRLVISGVIANPDLSVYGDYDQIDISDGYVATAIESNNKVAVDVGNGATIHTKFHKGKKYYGITKRDPDQSDQAVFKKYKDIDNVITFRVVGLNSTSNRVTLSTDYADYYVYSKDMKYLGRANQRLPFSTKYYLANKKLPVSTSK